MPKINKKQRKTSPNNKSAKKPPEVVINRSKPVRATEIRVSDVKCGYGFSSHPGNQNYNSLTRDYANSDRYKNARETENTREIGLIFDAFLKELAVLAQRTDLAELSKLADLPEIEEFAKHSEPAELAEFARLAELGASDGAPSVRFIKEDVQGSNRWYEVVCARAKVIKALRNPETAAGSVDKPKGTAENPLTPHEGILFFRLFKRVFRYPVEGRTSFTVDFGTGGYINNLSGNRVFRHLVKHVKKVSLRIEVKDDLRNRIYDAITSEGGSFVDGNEIKERRYAMQKIRQRFREEEPQDESNSSQEELPPGPVKHPSSKEVARFLDSLKGASRAFQEPTQKALSRNSPQEQPAVNPQISPQKRPSPQEVAKFLDSLKI